jgi:hypothetical protein
MPLGNLGACSNDLLEAEANIRQFTKEYCSIMSQRPRPKGLPPYIQPPKNSVRWQPGKDKPLTIPVGPETGLDILVWQERVPLGYDGILIQLSNVWNGTGFVEGSGDITWRVKIDRRFIPYYDTILETMSNLAVIPSVVVGEGIPLLSNQLVQYFVNFAVGSDANLNAGGKTICSVTGYIWPRERLLET